MFSDYFGGGGSIRANLPRDDTCTVLAEFGNEYADNGFERFVEKEKRRLRRESKTYPAWKSAGPIGTAQATSLDNKREREFREHLDRMYPQPSFREMRLQRAAENLVKAQPIRQAFEKQRDTEAHGRDLEFVDRRDVEMLPDGTSVRTGKNLHRRKSSTTSNNNTQLQLSRTASLRSLLNTNKSSKHDQQRVQTKKLTDADANLLRDYLAPPVQTRYEDPPKNTNMKRQDFFCSTEDDAGCPVDASIGTAGVFRQLKRWKQLVPKGSNFSSTSFDWPLRLDLPLREDARSFETLMADQLAAQKRAIVEEEDRARMMSSSRSTPVYFEGDGPGATILRVPQRTVYGDGMDSSSSSSDDENNIISSKTQNNKKEKDEDEIEFRRKLRDSKNESPERRAVLAAEAKRRHRYKLENRKQLQQQGYYDDDDSPIPTRAAAATARNNSRSNMAVASPVTTFPTSSQQHQQNCGTFLTMGAPISSPHHTARPGTAGTIKRGGAALRHGLSSAGSARSAGMITTTNSVMHANQQQQPSPRAAVISPEEHVAPATTAAASASSFAPRPPVMSMADRAKTNAARFRIVALDPRYVKSSVSSVGQRMIMTSQNTEISETALLAAQRAKEKAASMSPRR